MSDFKDFENRLIKRIARKFDVRKEALTREPPVEIVITKTRAVGPTTFLQDTVFRRGPIDR